MVCSNGVRSEREVSSVEGGVVAGYNSCNLCSKDILITSLVVSVIFTLGCLFATIAAYHQFPSFMNSMQPIGGLTFHFSLGLTIGGGVISAILLGLFLKSYCGASAGAAPVDRGEQADQGNSLKTKGKETQDTPSNQNPSPVPNPIPPPKDTAKQKEQPTNGEQKKLEGKEQSTPPSSDQNRSKETPSAPPPRMTLNTSQFELNGVERDYSDLGNRNDPSPSPLRIDSRQRSSSIPTEEEEESEKSKVRSGTDTDTLLDRAQKAFTIPRESLTPFTKETLRMIASPLPQESRDPREIERRVEEADNIIQTLTTETTSQLPVMSDQSGFQPPNDLSKEPSPRQRKELSSETESLTSEGEELPKKTPAQPRALFPNPRPVPATVPQSPSTTHYNGIMITRVPPSYPSSSEEEITRSWNIISRSQPEGTNKKEGKQ